MTPDANLTCPKIGCRGEYEFVAESDDVVAYRCEECGDELEQGPLSALSTDDGPTAELARVLLNGGDHS